MWGHVSSADGFRIMAFDILEPRSSDPGANAFFLSARVAAPAEAQARWDALCVDATIPHPLSQAPWSAVYGMLTDRFGVTWIVDVEPEAGYARPAIDTGP